ncbi:uncharacterized protein LOC127103148 [Lathyrus oleraceus]|uniref:uncharacterized protein LOC127103148 n=1 Tax=Pisum sativum TaxID=3888 RepID=UPI0021D10A96|nr:uncharacterized protein LOC127103148 [Pisum sativum]
MGTTHSFILLDCDKRLDLKLSSMVRSMVIDTPTNGSITTSLACLKCPLTIYDKSFAMDLVCLRLSQLDVILGMNWLDFNHVRITCFAKTVVFLEVGGDGKLMFISAKQVEKFLKEETHVFTMFATLGIENKVVMEELPVVCDFSKVFPDDITDFSPERKMEFSIDLVPDTSPVSLAPYRMFASKLSELKK